MSDLLKNLTSQSRLCIVGRILVALDEESRKDFEQFASARRAAPHSGPPTYSQMIEALKAMTGMSCSTKSLGVHIQQNCCCS